MRTSYCPFSYRQGQTGTVITGTEQELPPGSLVTINWLSWSSVQRVCSAQRGPEGQALHIAQQRPGPPQLICYMGH